MADLAAAIPSDTHCGECRHRTQRQHGGAKQRSTNIPDPNHVGYAEILQNLFGINNATFSKCNAFIDGIAEIALKPSPPQRLYGAAELSGVGTKTNGLRPSPLASVAEDVIVANADPVTVARPGIGAVVMLLPKASVTSVAHNFYIAARSEPLSQLEAVQLYNSQPDANDR